MLFIHVAPPKRTLMKYDNGTGVGDFTESCRSNIPPHEAQIKKL
jgi:hypothetical protein